jgi:hypothetical protein
MAVGLRMTKKPDELIRDTLKRRAEKAMAKRKGKSPSQKRSENVRKRMRNRE